MGSPFSKLLAISLFRPDSFLGGHVTQVPYFLNIVLHLHQEGQRARFTSYVVPIFVGVVSQPLASHCIVIAAQVLVVSPALQLLCTQMLGFKPAFGLVL